MNPSVGHPTTEDLERLAVRTYRRLRFDVLRPERPTTLVRSLLGPDRITQVDLPQGVRGTIVGSGDHQRILIARNAPIDAKLFTLAHELSHVLLEEEGYRGTKLEASCDYLAACLLAPRPATERLYREHGFDVRHIAAVSVQTDTWAILRVGEALGIPVAAIRPGKVRFRGQSEHLAFVPEKVLRSWGADMPTIPGLRKVCLNGSGRSAIVGVR